MRRLMISCVLLSVIVLAICSGCGQSGANHGDMPGSEAIVRSADGGSDKETARAEGTVDLGGQAAATNAAGLNRKIIYSAKVDLMVEDFTGVPDEVVALVKRFDAYVADSNLSGSSGTSRHGRWKVRVPVARFDAFVDAAKGLGELRSASTESKDVSEEYFDVDARIRNKTKEEERLLQLLEDRPGKLGDVITLERELSRVREEIERMQGRLRVLTDLTSLTTVDITIREIRGYEPPAAPTFATRVRRAFASSVAGVRTSGEETTIAAVALFPWLTVVAALLAISYPVVRAIYRRSRSAAKRPS
ncbi:MAG: DUF4349 domain-containing protein [Planctomycetia bacterium]|nr:DUF4349 domain-containing protein [Planctomycetia bacterium]